MLAELAELHGQVRQTFAEASEGAGVDLWVLSQDGPEEMLNSTEYTQPALLAAGIAVWRLWNAQGGMQPALLAGHSLGEYTALVAAGALRFADALPLVRFRAQCMQQAVPEGVGGIAAILGLDDDNVRAVCAEAAQGRVLEAVNYNSPGQVVIAGHRDAVERGMELAKAKGAKRALMLPMSVPSHCSLLKEAAGRLRDYLAEVAIQTPVIPVLHNADVQRHADAAGIRDALARQLYSPVRWVETILEFCKQGMVCNAECAPGKVLAGLNKRIDANQQALALNDGKALQAALESLALP